MRPFFALLILLAALSGCVNTKKYANCVKEVQRKFDPTGVSGDADIAIVYEGPNIEDHVVCVSRGRTANESMKAQLNAEIPVNIFAKYLYKYADSAGLREKIKGNKITLSIQSIPKDFTFYSEEFVDDYVLFTVRTVTLTIFPDTKGLVVSYRVDDDKGPKKEGKIEIQNLEMQVTSRKMTRKGITELYLTQYRKDVRKMTDEFINTLASEL